ncbi:hypothetical protein DFR86_11065 [Acidianus sulfidivorans JP7]|uniref:UPF0033 domain-containing protein n=1 Tax=Acidianus sulfidivorans JP7 TaxID=619593 RepID=A0A2U9IPS9_9CREN|nr:sulfurtransferase TusA family protein [Acidianus sulfidivorans]AWR98021.1 hypothetical protein DFR86_11065 [Acidianus sulfidivorans JP7]
MKIVVDLIGLCCSVPQMIVYSKLKKMKDTDLLEIIVEKNSSQDRDVINVIQHFNVYVETEFLDDKVIYRVRKMT